MEELDGYIEASLGDYSLQRYVGLVTGPITDSLAYSVSGSWHDTDGWMESATGKDLNGVKDWNMRGKNPVAAIRRTQCATHCHPRRSEH